MNWKEINEKYPKSFLEWIQSKKSKKISKVVDVINGQYVSFRFEIGADIGTYSISVSEYMIPQIPFYFDTLGITVNVNDINEAAKVWRDFAGRFDSSSKFYYVVKHTIHEESKESFPDRLAATIAGATKAFEIREAQLNTIL